MKNNNKGFTLIELLAVIVVLAVVIAIATTNVLPSMNIAREAAFRTETTLAVKNTKEAYLNYTLGSIKINNDTKSCVNDKKVCFTIDELIRVGASALKQDSYKGKIEINLENGKEVSYRVFLKKADEYWFMNEPFSDFSKNGDLNKGTWNEDAETCSCE